MGKNILGIIYCILTLFFSSICTAGSANLTIIHENSDLKVTKYILKYGMTEEADPSDYPNTLEIIPANAPVALQSTNMVDLGDGVSGSFYFSVQDVYSDGSTSSFSESSFPIVIPKKTENLIVQ